MTNSSIKTEKFFCLLLFLLPVFLFRLHIPGSYAIISLTFLMVFAFYFKKSAFRKIAFSFPLLVWLALTFYHVINAYVKHVPGVDAVDMLHGLKIYACIVIFTYWASKDLKATVKILILTYFIRNTLCMMDYMIFGGVKGMGRMTSSLGSETFLGQFAAITAIFVVYANALKKIPWAKTFFWLSVPFLVVILTQTRNCLAMFSFSAICIYVIKNKKARIPIFTSGLIVFALIVGLSFFAQTLLENTAFGQRIVAKSKQNDDSYFARNYATGTVFDKVVGDRLVYYVQGWSFFKQNPLTGIGMWRYESLSGGRYPLHSEYMVHVCEGGIVAFSLWSFFVLLVLRTILKYNDDKYVKYSALSSVFVLLFCGIYAREFFYEMFYPVYGIALSLKNDNCRIVMEK